MNSKLTIVFRILLALILLVFGSNKFFHFLEMPPMEGPSADFMGALNATGYMFTLIALTEIIAGALLLINKWSGLALIFTSIISVNIVLFHLVLAPAGIALAAVVAILNILLLYANWNKFKTLF
ncbi:DoxX family membrane protein [Lutibacter sp.]|uniref:DoxX family membrane protein n=1 Tax=Lutibacter sp. TaxID=1925666 RepID=UPI002736538F|nr:DoxX family membrane protein [Lutibacter sp.]MDP3312929.1 DoxX family membrane protein [Lutibacter sp.]